MPVRICPSNDNGYCTQGWVFELVFFNKIVKSAFVIVMCKLDAGDVKRNRVQRFGLWGYFIEGNINDLGIFINESLDQPGAGDPVDLWSFSGYPFTHITQNK